MKILLLTALFLFTGGRTLFGRPNAAAAVSPNAVAATRSGAAATDLPAERRPDRDPVWQEALADGTLDMRVFGRYARDERRYRTLAERFERADTTLRGSDLFILYYGHAYRNAYDGGYAAQPWRESMAKKQYDKAYAQVRKALRQAPATPHLLNDAIRIARALGRPDEEIRNLAWRRNILLIWICASGDGTAERPFVVVNTQDEYTLAHGLLRVREVRSQTPEPRGTTFCDRLEIEPVDNELFSGSEIWFDCTYPLPMPAEPHKWAKELRDETGAETPSHEEN